MYERESALCVDVCASVHACHMHVGICNNQRRVSGALELELGGVCEPSILGSGN